ncbi:hypothetical protein C1701_05405 [Actinoalloteichus sp. AHMU CJ021]|uniref:hypothetical protein n=2 Tax=Actinoalloteichus TaxID=65496 RepID=UPI000CA02134|nr:hypothetical protein C1701_05405 [Actinoalloteichus sp. AHMU CJ021]
MMSASASEEPWQEIPDVHQPGPDNDEPLSVSEQLDEDDLDVDPLEEGVEPPEDWSEANRFGTTPSEQRAGEGLDARLNEEVPDVGPVDAPDRGRAETPAEEVDELPPDDEFPDEPAQREGVVLQGDVVDDNGFAAEDVTGRTAQRTDATEEGAIRVEPEE